MAKKMRYNPKGFQNDQAVGLPETDKLVKANQRDIIVVGKQRKGL